jgi:hypothetical protein
MEEKRFRISEAFRGAATTKIGFQRVAAEIVACGVGPWI